MSSSPNNPPFFVLVSQKQSPLTAGPSSLIHPVIQYHYADDSPDAFLPGYPGEQVLVIDYDPAAAISSPPVVQSLSEAAAVSRVKVTDAPGAAIAAKEDPVRRNEKMYIIETASSTSGVPEMDDTITSQAASILAQFKYRNEVMRSVLNAGNPQDSFTG